MSRAFRLHSLARRLTITAVPVILVVPLVTAVALPGSSKASDAGQGGAVPTVNWALSGQASLAVEEIDDALKRIDDKTFGYCERCFQPIPKPRLRALPYARLCVACKSGGLSRR